MDSAGYLCNCITGKYAGDNRYIVYNEQMIINVRADNICMIIHFMQNIYL